MSLLDRMSNENEYTNLKKNRSVCRSFLVTNTENQIKTLLQNFNMNNDEHEAKLEGLTLTWVGFLGVRFLSWMAVGVKLPSPSLKLIWYVNADTVVVSENIPLCTKIYQRSH